ncbi:nonribosomal peptide synthetase MxaA [Methylobacterium sp. A54F]
MRARSPWLRVPALLPALAAGLCAGAAVAQVRAVEVRSPRPFGYVLGDLVRAQVEIRADAGFGLQRASLPVPGPVTYWLDLREVAVEETAQGAENRIRLRLTYQTFYAALDARSLEVPGFAVTLVSEQRGGATTAAAQVPAWALGVSPLREVQPPKRDDPAEYLRPDGPPARPDPGPDALAALAALALAGLALLVLAWDRAWWFFAPRRGRPFAAALRRVRRQPRPAGDAGLEAAAYRAALLALHRGVDETAGARVLADDLAGFLDGHPAFRSQAQPLARAFAASRLAFFGRDTEAARAALPAAEIEAMLRRLAARERAA